MMILLTLRALSYISVFHPYLFILCIFSLIRFISQEFRTLLLILSGQERQNLYLEVEVWEALVFEVEILAAPASELLLWESQV